MKSVMEAYSSLLQAQANHEWRPLAVMTPVSIEVSVVSAQTPDSLWAIIRESGALVGWLQGPSEQALIRGELPAGLAGKPLLAGELVNGSTTITITLGHGEWRVTSVRELPGDSHMSSPVSWRATDGSHRLHYRRYWLHEEGKGYSVVGSRFVGFGEGE